MSSNVNHSSKSLTRNLSSSQNGLNEIKKDVGFSLQIGKYQLNEIKRKSQADLSTQTNSIRSNLSGSLHNISSDYVTNLGEIDGFDMKKFNIINKSELNGIC